MKYTAIYNMKSSNFHRFSNEKIPTIDEIISSDDYIVVGDVEADTIDDVYMILNVNHPPHILEKICRYAAVDNSHEVYPTLHTNMSVGDVIFSDDKYYFCDNFGWEDME